MISLGLICDSVTDTSSFYRGMGPFGALRRYTSDLVVTSMHANVSWDVLKEIDVLVLQRPHTPMHLKICEMALLNRKPVWLDFDDDFTSIPESNPAFRTYNTPEVKKAILALLRCATIITVSTEHLQKVYATITDKPIAVIPNAFDDHIFMANRKGKEHRNVVLWRGTSTHLDDLEEIQGQLAAAAQSVAGYNFLFWGFKPGFIDRAFAGTTNNCIYEMPVDPVIYFYQLYNMAPKVIMVPLMDHQFNRCKSNCAWLEAMWAGSIVVAPNWPEWQRPGVINYSSPSDFGSVLEEAISYAPGEVVLLNQQGWGHVKSKFLLSQINTMRKDILGQLIK